MAHLSWPLLYFLSFYPQLGLAGQLFTGFLSPSIAQAIPTCAQDCVALFLAEDYPDTICSQKDLDCVCKINSVSGFTLGEGSLRCVVSACLSTNTIDDSVAAYYICSGINGARSMTHGTITATVPTRRTVPATPVISALSQSPLTSQSSTPSTSFLPFTTTLWSSTATTLTSLPSRTSDTFSSTTTRITLASGSPPLPPPTSMSSSTSTITPTTLAAGSPHPLITSTSSSTLQSKFTYSAPSTGIPPTAAAIAAVAKPILSKPQIAGVAVAAVVSLLALCALIFFIFCFRRRRNGRDRSSFCSSFGDNKTNISRPSSPGPYHPIGGNAEHGNRARDLARVDAQGAGPGNPRIVEGTPASYWRRSPVRAEEIGIALGSPAMMQAPVLDETPKSVKSHRTISQLLPDKPIYSLYPAPLRINHLNTPTSPVGAVVPGAAGIGQRSAIPLSKPAPLGNKSSDISPQRNFSNLRPSASDPYLDSSSGRSASTYPRQGRQRGPSKDPIRDLPHPEVLNYGQWTQSLDSLQKPAPAQQSTSAHRLNQQRAAYDSISPGNFIGPSEFGSSTQPRRQLSIPRKPLPRQPPPRRIRRPLTRYSSASETSFEDAGDDDDMPRAQAFLSPVAESYARRSSRGHGGPLRPPVSAYSRYQRLEPVSPTPKSSQRRQPPPLITPATDPRLLKNMLKPLPEVPESNISDSSTPLMGKRRADIRVPRGPRPNPNDSPRGETELTKSAKWKILVGPGLQGLDNVGAPRSGRSNEWGYNTLTTGRAPQ